MGIGLEAVTQPDAGHAETTAPRHLDEAAERLELLLVEAAHVLGNHGAEEHGPERGAARG